MFFPISKWCLHLKLRRDLKFNNSGSYIRDIKVSKMLNLNESGGIPPSPACREKHWITRPLFNLDTFLFPILEIYYNTKVYLLTDRI